MLGADERDYIVSHAHLRPDIPEASRFILRRCPLVVLEQRVG